MKEFKMNIIMQKQSTHIKYKKIYSNPASDIVHSVKTNVSLRCKSG